MPLQVTDHAVLRYLERAGGFDIEGIRREIAGMCEEAARAGAASVQCGNVKFYFSECRRFVTTAAPVSPKPNGVMKRRYSGK